jgi:hypothetical protein
MFKRIVVLLAGFAVLLTFNACNDQPNSPDQFDSVDQELFKFETLESDISLMKAGGMQFVEGDGIFSLGWNEVFRRFDDDSHIKGMAFAVVFGDENTGSSHFPGYGLNMGTITINYSDNAIEMHKMSHDRRGIAYSLFHRPFGGSDHLLEYIPNTDYQFVVSGSDQFSPVTITLTSPSSLMDINSHSHGDLIDVSDDLTITWEGGNSTDNVAIRIMPHFKPGKDGMNHGGKGGSGGRGKHHPPRHHSKNAIIEILIGNPGEYTISAETLQNLVNRTGAEKIVIGVSQLDAGEIEHDGKTLTTAMRNGNSVMLSVQ